jgi:hypothetical protein
MTVLRNALRYIVYLAGGQPAPKPGGCAAVITYTTGRPARRHNRDRVRIDKNSNG